MLVVQSCYVAGRLQPLRYHASTELSPSHDCPRHGPLQTATVAPATPLPASNEPHPPCRCSPLFDARRATDAGVSPSSDDRLRRWARAPLIVVRRPPSADRGPLPTQRRSLSPVHLRPLSCQHFAPPPVGPTAHLAVRGSAFSARTSPLPARRSYVAGRRSPDADHHRRPQRVLVGYIQLSASPISHLMSSCRVRRRRISEEIPRGDPPPPPPPRQ